MTIAKSLMYLLILSFPLFGIKMRTFRPDWWVGTFFIIIIFLYVLLNKKIRMDFIGRAILGLHISVFLSLFINSWDWNYTNWFEFLTLWLQFLFATSLFYALANFKISLKEFKSIIKFWIGTAVFIAFYGLYQLLARNFNLPLAYIPYLHPTPSVYYLKWGLGFAGYIRPSSILREPSYFGSFLLPPLLLLGILILTKKDKLWLFKNRNLNYFSFFILFSAFLASFALSSYITLMTLIVLAIFFGPRSRKISLRFVLLTILTITILVTLFLSINLPFAKAFTTRIHRITATLVGESFGLIDASTKMRLMEASAALNIWMNHPFLGVGLNQTQFYIEKHYEKGTFLKKLKRGYVHNMWLGVLVQLGIMGLSFFFLIWFSGLLIMQKVFHNNTNEIKWIALCFFYILLALMIRGLMAGPFTFSMNWFYLGLASLINNLAKQTQFK